MGSPPIPTQVDCPKPSSVVCFTASYVKVPERETIPTLPFLCMCPGIMPILHSSGVITPGQFGPIITTPVSFNFCFTLSISNVGMPSVMQTINLIPASMASIMASLQNGAGT